MKKFLMIAATASVLATPAMAADWQGKTYGQDAVGLYDLNAEADGTFNLDIQNDADDTVQFAQGRYKIANAVCNTSHELTVQSTNGGLRNSATTSDTAFLSLVPYNVAILFDGNGAQTSSTSATSQFTLSTIREARAGAAEVSVVVPAQDKLLIKGRYTDRLVAAIRPMI